MEVLKIYTSMLLTAFTWLLFASDAQAQKVVQDQGNKGQLMRMVATRWDYWRPDPTWTKVFGVPIAPKNIYGSEFWGLLHRKYYKGKDRRPYRADGPFPANMAALLLEKEQQQKIEDSLKSVEAQHLEDVLNMQGGITDLPYSLYFNRKFDETARAFGAPLLLFLVEDLDGAKLFMNSTKYKNYMDFVSMTLERIQTTHNSFVDKGERIIQYLNYLNEWERKLNVILGVLNAYRSAVKIKPELIREDLQPLDTAQIRSDRKIANDILSNYKF